MRFLKILAVLLVLLVFLLAGVLIVILLVNNPSSTNTAANTNKQPIEFCDYESTSGNVVVKFPCSKKAASNTIVLEGSAKGIFENNLNYRVTSNTGDILKEGFVVVDSPDFINFGEFKKEINLPANSPGPVTLEVFQASAKDGSEKDLVSLVIEMK